MSENMLTIDRLSDFTVVGPLKACRMSDIDVLEVLNRVFCDRLSDVDVLEALSRAICDKLSDIGVLEGSNQTSYPTEYLTLLCLSVL